MPETTNKSIDADFDAWALCYRISRLFIVERFFPSNETITCFACQKKDCQPWSKKYYSNFIKRSLRCSVGHLNYYDEDADVCARCNQDFILKLVKRQQICPREWCSTEGCVKKGSEWCGEEDHRKEKCRRILQIDEDGVEWRCSGDKELWTKFKELLNRNETFECLIHGEDDTPLSKAHKLSSGTECNHEPNICSLGLKQVLEAAISSFRLNDLICPDTDCKAQISEADLRKLVSREHFADYKRKLSQRNMTKDPDYRKCRASPNNQPCQNGQIVVRIGNQLQWRCVLCESWNCFDCSPTTTCERHLRYAKEDLESQKKIRETTKMCPRRGCGTRIEYAGQCAHMTCREKIGGCGAEFCWNCKIIWNSANPKMIIAKHLQDCSLRKPSNPPIPKPPTTGDETYAPGWDADTEYDKSLDKQTPRGLWLIQGHQ